MTNITARIICDTAHNAAFNMAADQYLLAECEKRQSFFIRFYTWNHPSITIGYMQDPKTTLLAEALQRHGAEWVRRPTGGRAVLHQGDITYSCVFSTSIESMGSSVAETFAIISKALMVGLSQLNIKCQAHDTTLTSSDIRRDAKLPCFLAPNRDELMVNGRKLVGSAQKRSANAVLQHGSIPLTAEFRQLPAFQNLTPDQVRHQCLLLEEKCICLSEIDPTLSVARVIDALTAGFTISIPNNWRHEPFSKAEISIIEQQATNADFLNRWCR